MRAVVVGAAGYVGGELLRLVLQHPEIRAWTATSRSQAGKPVAAVHPHLAPLTDAVFSGDDPAAAARGADVVFLALEHGESSKLAEGILASGAGLVVDLAADFRVADLALHARYYGPHPAPALVPLFRYGLADVEGGSLRGARAIAAPGCFATAAQLALWPLRHLPGAAPAMVAITGSSGAGVHPKPTTHHPARAHNLFAYQVMAHRHEAEVLQSWRRWSGRADAEARLLTHSGPFVRGIHLTLHTRLSAAVQDAPGLLREAYAGRPFVRVLDAPPELTHAVGTNHALLHAAASDDGRELAVFCVLDNLVKGAGGQAVQAMNLALGLPETAGLTGGGIFPC